MSRDSRYQNQSWYVKLWRSRYRLVIPYQAICIWWRERSRELRHANDWKLNFDQSWALATGLADGKMNWWISTQELDAIEEEQAKSSYKITFGKFFNFITVKVDSNDNWIGIGRSKQKAIKDLRKSICCELGGLTIKNWWFSRRIKFSKIGKL